MWTIPISKIKPTLPPGWYWVMVGTPYTRGGVTYYPRNYAHAKYDGQGGWSEIPHHVQMTNEQVNQFTEWRV